MRRSIVAALAALAVCVALPSVAAAKTCSAGYVHAVIGGAQKCLRRGEYCAVRDRTQYKRYGFVCADVNGTDRLEPKASTAAARGFAALNGKRLAGTSSSTWLPIASPFKHPTNLDGTITPPVADAAPPLSVADELTKLANIRARGFVGAPPAHAGAASDSPAISTKKTN